MNTRILLALALAVAHIPLAMSASDEHLLLRAGTSLRCISFEETPMGDEVQSLEYPEIEARDVRISLLEFRSRKDSVPLWARAYVPQGRDIIEFTFTAKDEQAYNRGMPAFREMLASFRIAKSEANTGP